MSNEEWKAAVAGVFIYGALGIAILAAAGIASGNKSVVAFSVVAAGASYVCQCLVAMTKHNMAWPFQLTALLAAVAALAFYIGG